MKGLETAGPSPGRKGLELGLQRGSATPELNLSGNISYRVQLELGWEASSLPGCCVD